MTDVKFEATPEVNIVGSLEELENNIRDAIAYIDSNQFRSLFLITDEDYHEHRKFLRYLHARCQALKSTGVFIGNMMKNAEETEEQDNGKNDFVYPDPLR